MKPSSLPSEIVVHDLPDGIRYILPRRPRQQVQWSGWWRVGAPAVFVLLGFAWSVSAVVISASIFSSFSADDFVSNVFRIVAAAGGGVGLLIGVAPLAMVCYAILNTGMEIQMRSGRLYAIERMGPFRWRRSRPLKKILQYELLGCSEFAGRPTTRGGDQNFIMAHCDQPEPFFNIGRGYPAEWLAPLAVELAWRTEAALAHFSDSPRAIEFENRVQLDQRADCQDLIQKFTADVAEQPQQSRIACQMSADGVTLIIPPDPLARLRRKGQLMAMIIGFGIVGVSTALVVLAGLFADFPPLVKVAIFAIFAPVLLIFWVVLLGVLWQHLATGCERVKLEVLDETLMIEHQGAFRTKRHTWPRDQIAAIRLGWITKGPSDVERESLELQIHLVNGVIVGLLERRPHDELRWIATKLRRALELNQQPRVGR